MEAQVKRDNTVRTIVIEVSGVPDFDVTRSYHKKPRIFRPDQVTLTVTDGVLGWVNVSGPLVLKSGGVSETVRENERWYSVRDLDDLPAWLAILCTTVLTGTKSWSEPEAQQL